MRILFHSGAGFGHLFPLLPFARAALAARDDVRFAVPAETVATVEEFGYAASTLPTGDPGDIGRAWAQLPDHDVNTYERVLNDSRYRTNAQRVAAEIRSQPSPAEALNLLRNDFVGAWAGN